MRVSAQFLTTTYTPSTPTTHSDFTAEYYFQDSSPTISSIPYINGSINDYCPGRHPLTRTQRYSSACTSSNLTLCYNGYQIWSGCQQRNNFAYSSIPNTFFTASSASIDDATNFADFNNATSVLCMSF